MGNTSSKDESNVAPAKGTVVSEHSPNNLNEDDVKENNDFGGIANIGNVDANDVDIQPNIVPTDNIGNVNDIDIGNMGNIDVNDIDIGSMSNVGNIDVNDIDIGNMSNVGNIDFPIVPMANNVPSQPQQQPQIVPISNIGDMNNIGNIDFPIVPMSNNIPQQQQQRHHHQQPQQPQQPQQQQIVPMGNIGSIDFPIVPMSNCVDDNLDQNDVPPPPQPQQAPPPPPPPSSANLKTTQIAKGVDVVLNYLEKNQLQTFSVEFWNSAEGIKQVVENLGKILKRAWCKHSKEMGLG